jgi:allatostatin A receptor
MELENSSTSEKLIRNNISLEMSNNENHYTPFELKIAILISITFGITIIVGIVGNSLVLLTILLQKQMRSTTNILILNLAFAELLFILLCVPFTGFNYVLR